LPRSGLARPAGLCDDALMKVRARPRRWRCWLRRRRRHADVSAGAWAAAQAVSVLFPPAPEPQPWWPAAVPASGWPL